MISGTYTTAGVTIKDVNFAAQSINGDACIRLGDGTNKTTIAAAYTWNGIHVAAVSIDGSQGGTYVVNLEGTNTVDSDMNGLWQIKAGETKVTVNE